MRSLHGVLHGGLWIGFHGLPEFTLGLPPRGGPDANFERPWFFNVFLNKKLPQHDKFHNRFQDWKIPPSSSLKLVEFETYYMKPNPPLFFRQQNMQWARNMVHSHFTLCLRFRDYLNGFPNTQWYNLWMRVKGSSPLQGHGSWLMCEVAPKPPDSTHTSKTCLPPTLLILRKFLDWPLDFRSSCLDPQGKWGPSLQASS